MAKITGFPLLPVRYRLSPTDNELVRDYLMIKSAGMPILGLRGLKDYQDIDVREFFAE